MVVSVVMCTMEDFPSSMALMNRRKNICIILPQVSGILQGLKDRLARSWYSKRGRKSAGYTYNSNTETNWNIALQQLQSLLPAVKEAEEKCEVEEGAGDGAKRHIHKKESVQEPLNQHSSKPSAYI